MTLRIRCFGKAALLVLGLFAIGLLGIGATGQVRGVKGQKQMGGEKPSESAVKFDANRLRTFTFRPIGVIRSPYTRQTGAPRQGRLESEKEARIEIYSEFAEGLESLEQFSHIVVLWVFDRSRDYSLTATPPGEAKTRGVFATRSPHRPCPIGLTIVPLDRRDVDVLYVRGMDAFDGTPVLDIKPYIPSIDSFPEAASTIDIQRR